jgi:bifunctional non-homologous end joining protein LigD
MSRNQLEITGTFPELGPAPAAQLTKPGCVLEGEIVAFDGAQTSFARLQQRLGVRHPGETLLVAAPVFYYLFDVMYADGRGIRPLPQRECKHALRELLSFSDPVRYTEHRDRDGEQYFLQACQDRWEGLIAKRGDAPYRPGAAATGSSSSARTRRSSSSAATPTRRAPGRVSAPCCSATTTPAAP